MSSIVLLALIAGISFLGFLLLAALVWMIRARRWEKGDMPKAAPWKSAPNPAASGEAPATPMEGRPWEQWIRHLSPGISTLMELEGLVKKAETPGQPPASKEEKRQGILKAIEELAEKQPDNVFLRQMRDSIRNSLPNMNNSVQVFRIGTTTTIRVDGTSYTDVESIPDPEKREQARKILKTLGSAGLSNS
jgi:hypothetical protein